MPDFNPIIIVPHQERRLNEESKKYEDYNIFEEIRKMLIQMGLEKEYGRCVGVFNQAYGSKTNEERYGEIESKINERMFKSTKSFWVSFGDSKPNMTVEDFLKKIAPMYKEYENSQDKFWRAPFGFKAPVIVRSEEKFLEGISRGVYAATAFREEYKIKPRLDRNGKSYKPSQRSIENAVSFMPTAIFDVDQGLSMADAAVMLDKFNMAYAMVTTKSHGIKEGDRFRIFIPLSYDGKDQSFKTNGMEFDSDDQAIKTNRIKEIAFLQYQIAIELGIYDYVDKSPLGDIARKYMPSPPVGAPNHVSVVKMDRAVLDITTIAKRAREAKLAYDEEQKRIRTERLSQYDGETDILKIMETHPEWRIVYDNAFLMLIDPLEIVYRYESEAGEDVKLLNAWSSNPRVKVSGHHYAIWLPAESEGYIIKDFVSGESTNLLGYLKNRFPGMEQFDRFKKLEKDFGTSFGKNRKIIQENPYYYINKMISIFKDPEVKTRAHIMAKLEEEKIVTIEIGRRDIVVQKLNGFKMRFQIADDNLPSSVKTDSALLADYRKVSASFLQNAHMNSQPIQANIIKK